MTSNIVVELGVENFDVARIVVHSYRNQASFILELTKEVNLLTVAKSYRQAGLKINFLAKRLTVLD